jgi:hypothetical protein
MDKEFERKLKLYRTILSKGYVHVYFKKKKFALNHVKIIINLLNGNPDRLWNDEFVQEVERYEMKFFGKYVRRNKKTLSWMKRRIKKLRKEYKLVEELFKRGEYNLLLDLCRTYNKD